LLPYSFTFIPSFFLLNFGLRSRTWAVGLPPTTVLGFFFLPEKFPLSVPNAISSALLPLLGGAVGAREVGLLPPPGACASAHDCEAGCVHGVHALVGAGRGLCRGVVEDGGVVVHTDGEADHHLREPEGLSGVPVAVVLGGGGAREDGDEVHHMEHEVGHEVE
jgi:hypothetical protein